MPRDIDIVAARDSVADDLLASPPGSYVYNRLRDAHVRCAKALRDGSVGGFTEVVDVKATPLLTTISAPESGRAENPPITVKEAGPQIANKDATGSAHFS